MSEPKGPPAIDERRPSKKAVGSKKNSAPPIDATPGPSAPPPAAAAPGSGPPTVPRIPLASAEPKPAVSQGDGKPRASKKRTSATPSDLPPSFEAATASARAPTAGPTSVAPDAAIAVAKAEADAAAAAARREAKKQRAREVEEQKKREELERRAAEELRRIEEQRQRDERQRQRQAVLNANAEECQEEPDEQNEYEEDGFENYDDDGFEADDSAPPKPTALTAKPTTAKAYAKSRGSTSQDADLTGRELEKIQHALQAESKELQSTSRPSSSSTSDNNRSEAPPAGSKATSRSGSAASSTISSSIAGLKQTLDPRAKRVKEILEVRKSFDIDKFSLFQQNPVSEQDRLMQRLRRGAVRQGFVQTSEGARPQATQTKPPPSEDKSMHFPDDIGLDSAISTSLSARNTGSGDNNAEGDPSMSGASSSSRFFRFLEHAAYTCEVLAVENSMTAEKAKHDQAEAKFSGNDSIDSKGKDMDATSVKKRFELSPNTPVAQKVVLPCAESKKKEDVSTQLELERMLKSRSLVELQFSPVISNLLLACYVDNTVDSKDISPEESKLDSKQVDDEVKAAGSENGKAPRRISYRGKSLSCVWDINQPSQPVHILKNEGAISSAMLSPTRELFVLAGSTDGSIYVWDLRQNALLTSTATIDGVAVSAPVYSTCGATDRGKDLTNRHHSSQIVSIEPIIRTSSTPSSSASSIAGGNFQFGSMDDRGVLIVWSLVELDGDDEALVADKCAEIGARVKLVMNARIDTQRMYMAPNTSANDNKTSSAQRKSTISSTASKSKSVAIHPTSFLNIGPVASAVKFLPHDPNQLRFLGHALLANECRNLTICLMPHRYIVGTHTGTLVRGHRFEQNQKSFVGAASFRTFYRQSANNSGLLRGLGSAAGVNSVSSAGVVSIAMNPFEPDYFLVGYDDGEIWCVSSRSPTTWLDFS